VQKQIVGTKACRVKKMNILHLRISNPNQHTLGSHFRRDLQLHPPPHFQSHVAQSTLDFSVRPTRTFGEADATQFLIFIDLT
jgi:hypothetical protein